MLAADGKKSKIQSPDSKGLLRIVQSIPSPKAEPFKQTLGAMFKFHPIAIALRLQLPEPETYSKKLF